MYRYRMRSRHLIRRKKRFCSSTEVIVLASFSTRWWKRVVSNCSWENINEAELDLSRLDKTLPCYVMQKDPPTDRRLGAVIEIFIQESYRERRYYRKRPFTRRGKTAKRVGAISYLSINVSRTYTCISDLDTFNNLFKSYFITLPEF